MNKYKYQEISQDLIYIGTYLSIERNKILFNDEKTKEAFINKGKELLKQYQDKTIQKSEEQLFNLLERKKQLQEQLMNIIDSNPELIDDEIAKGDWSRHKYVSKKNGKYVYFHGTASGDLRGGWSGLHIGTHLAAKEALEATIGVRADGKDWDGTSKYGNTLLAGKKTLEVLGKDISGFNCFLPEEDFYIKDLDENKKAKFSNKELIPENVKPSILKFTINGKMKELKGHNKYGEDNSDEKANMLMKKNKDKNINYGYYYTNISEDEGSISAVVPNKEFLEEVSDEDVIEKSSALETLVPRFMDNLKETLHKNKVKGKQHFSDAIIMNDKGEILMLFRNINKNPDLSHKWSLPGGHIDKGESEEDACKREVLEETNLVVNSCQLFYVKECNEAIINFFKCYVDADQQLLILDAMEHSNLKWVSKEELQELDCIYDLKDTLNKIVFPDLGGLDKIVRNIDDEDIVDEITKGEWGHHKYLFKRNNDEYVYANGGGYRHKPVGGNSGYVGYSMSKRAESAYEDGKLPHSKLPIWAKRLVDAGLVESDEWHHTSSYGNETTFYNIGQFDIFNKDEKKELNIDDWDKFESFKDVPKNVIKAFDIKSKAILKLKNNIKEIRKEYIQRAQKEFNDFNSKFKRYSRISSSPKYGETSEVEMNGKYGWFSAQSKYSLDRYYSGIDYETEENQKQARRLEKTLLNAQYDPIYQIELEKRGFDVNDINKLKSFGIITSEIMPKSFYDLAEKNKDIINIQLKNLSNLPKIDDKFKPDYERSFGDSFLTDEEKQKRQDRHNMISEMGENFGTNYERREEHEQNDRDYREIANKRSDEFIKEFQNSDEYKNQEKKFNEDKFKAQNIVNNLKSLFGIETEIDIILKSVDASISIIQKAFDADQISEEEYIDALKKARHAHHKYLRIEGKKYIYKESEGKLKVDWNQDLVSEAHKSIEKKFAKYLNTHLDEAEKIYKAKFKNVLGGDNAKELSEDYEKDRTNLSEAVHEPSSAFIKYLYDKELDRKLSDDEDNTIVFTAGGSGAGKSSGLTQFGDLNEIEEKADIVYDTTMTSFNSADGKIRRALEHGRDVCIISVYREPIDAFVNGVIPRLIKTGRSVPYYAHSKNHIMANKVIEELYDKYKDNEHVSFHFIDNSKGKGKAVEISIDDLKKIEFKTEQEYSKELETILNTKLKNNEITEQQFKALKGSRFENNNGQATSRNESKGEGTALQEKLSEESEQIKKSPLNKKIFKFLDKMRYNFYDNNGEYSKLEINDVNIEVGLENLADDEESLFLNDIKSNIPGKGNASKVLKAIINYANEFDLPISLRASSGGHYNSSGLKQEDLIKWYERNGFELRPEASNFGRDEIFMVKDPNNQITKSLEIIQLAFDNNQITDEQYFDALQKAKHIEKRVHTSKKTGKKWLENHEVGSDEEITLYHNSQSFNRENILNNGLDYKKGNKNWYVAFEGGNYFWESKEKAELEAKNYSEYGMYVDIFEVKVNQKSLFKDDIKRKKVAFYTKDKIDKNKIKLVSTYMMGEKTNKVLTKEDNDFFKEKVNKEIVKEKIKPYLEKQSTEHQSSQLITYLEQLSNMMKDNPQQKAFFDWEKNNAKQVKIVSTTEIRFKYPKIDEYLKQEDNQPEIKQCYSNAAKLATNVEGVEYVEGMISMMGIPIDHAWNKIGNEYFDITKDIALSDATIPNDEYLSIIELDAETTLEYMLDTQVYGGYIQQKYMRDNNLQRFGHRERNIEKAEKNKKVEFNQKQKKEKKLQLHEYEDDDLKLHAERTSEKHLKRIISESSNPRLRQFAQEELDNRDPKKQIEAEKNDNLFDLMISEEPDIKRGRKQESETIHFEKEPPKDVIDKLHEHGIKYLIGTTEVDDEEEKLQKALLLEMELV